MCIESVSGHTNSNWSSGYSFWLLITWYMVRSQQYLTLVMNKYVNHSKIFIQMWQII